MGFRSVLVHKYAEVDEDVVMANLDSVDDLVRFVAEVVRWTSDKTGG